MQVRARRESGRANVADDLFLVDALTEVEPRSEARQMPIAGLNAIRMTQLDEIAVAAVASGLRDDAVGRSPHGRAVRRRVIGPLVRSPPFKNRMKPPAEAARDVAEAQRRAQERAAQRPPLVVVEPDLAVRIVERKREAGRARDVHPRGKNVTQALFPDRKSTRLNSSHLVISYAVFCLKKKKKPHKFSKSTNKQNTKKKKTQN